MDYQLVYRRFIESRRSRRVDGYFEVHHVLPRAFGGDDSDENLIILSPEDHFFAHLLLAKIYGGRMIAALFLMSNRRWMGRPNRSIRSSYGLMRREWSEYAKTQPGLFAEANGMYRHDVFEWLNMDTLETRHATLGEMWAEFGGNRGMWTQVLTGSKTSALGWVIAANMPRIRGLKGKAFKFVNDDGREFIGTQTEFCKAHGVNAATASRISRGGSVSKDGWRLESSKIPPPPRLGKGKTFRLTKGGVEFVGKRAEAAEHLCITPQQFSAAVNYVKTRQSTYKGWHIEAIT